MTIQQAKNGHYKLSLSTKTASPFTFASRSIAHQKHPDRNEDAIIIDKRRGLAAVFDGVGGANAGEVASRLGAHVIQQAWKRIIQQLHPDRPSELLRLSDELDIQALLFQILEEAQASISEEGERREKAQAIQVGKDLYPETTAVVTVFCHHPEHKGYVMAYAHVGDSRAYLLRGHEPLKRLTLDDGYFMLKIRDQTLSEVEALRIDQATHPDQLTAMERDIFNKRNGITQCLGHFTPKNSSLTIHTAQIEIFPGDRILLCSDGIHDNLTDAEIEAIIRQKARTTVAHHLIQRVLSRSQEICLRAKQDDMSAVIITCNF